MSYSWKNLSHAGQQEQLVADMGALDPDTQTNRRGRRARASIARKQGAIIDGNATAAGMNRLFEAKNVKDTVKK